jgi:YgiT-type zinc finger domain-containing protein
MYDFPCEHCSGNVKERVVEKEALRHKGEFVILEQVPIGICEKCGARYFDASVLRRVAEVARDKAKAAKRVEVAMAPFRETA